MTRTLFLRRFNRGLPQAIRYALIVLIALALMDHFKGSLFAESTPLYAPALDSSQASFAMESAWISSPRECDLPAGISTDCVFMD